MDKLIFNSSMPRSGSELFQVICHQNPDIYASPTSPLLEYQFGARANYDLPEIKSQNPELMQFAFSAMCKGMAEAYYSAITGRSIIIDKNRGWAHYYEWVAQWNPEPKIICVIRDLRDVFASFERIFRANRHSPQGPDNPAKMQNMTTAERVHYWGNTQPVGLALQRTVDSFQRNVADKLLFVRYEDLCSEPQQVMKTFYDYVGIPAYAHDFKNIEKHVQEDDAHYGIFGQHKVLKELQPYQKGRWSDVLSDSIATQIVNDYRWFFNTFNYEI